MKVNMDAYAEVWGTLKSWPSRRLEQIQSKIAEELERRAKVVMAKQESIPLAGSQ